MVEFVNITTVNAAIDHIPVDICHRIKDKLRRIDSRNAGCDFDLWEATAGDPDFEYLKSAMLNLANTLVSSDSNRRSAVEIDRAWPLSYGDWEYQAPHHHGTTFVIGVAYIDVSEDAGDILIQDPLAAYDWVQRKDKRNNSDCRASIAITPVTGMITAMPGYLVHSTEPKPAGKTRLIIATNFNPVD